MKERSVHIYAIGRADGPIKIGISAHPGGRALDLQSGCPFEISLLYNRECRDRAFALQQERIIHSVYAGRRLTGEWFDIDQETAIEAIDTAIEIAEHFESRAQ